MQTIAVPLGGPSGRKYHKGQGAAKYLLINQQSQVGNACCLLETVYSGQLAPLQFQLVLPKLQWQSMRYGPLG